MASGDLIDFEIIENQKENIQSLPGGRSARSLANLFSSPLHPLATPTPSDTKSINDIARAEYEEELANICESDDPLDIYDRYVKWTFDAYPSAQGTPASGLLSLLERATKAFLNSTQYKNDPRYLKLWISYIRFFSDTPRETFAFLARHNIGDNLALFYEEFAAWLEGAGRFAQAEEIYTMGIEKEARPTARLVRKFNEFQQRSEQRPHSNNEPSSPALPAVRAALGVKVDPFAAAAPRDPQAPRPNSGVSSAAPKSGRQKLQIFSDADEPAPAISASSGSKGWDSIGSLAERKKENTMEPKPWVGETLKAGGKKSSTKMAVFKDESLVRFEYPQVTNPKEQQVIINQKGRIERIFVNLEAVYPSPDVMGSELSLEELRARHRGWLSKTWEAEIPTSQVKPDTVLREIINAPETEILPPSRGTTTKLVVLRDAEGVDENGVARIPAREGRPRRMKIKEVNETQIIKAKLSSPSGPKIKKRKASKEQTMTLHTKAANDEIYDLFSQPLKPAEVEEEEEEEESEESEDDDGDTTDGDYTSGGESTTTGRQLLASEAGDDETSDVKSVSEWSEFTTRKHVPNVDDEEENTQASQFSEIDAAFEILDIQRSAGTEERPGDEPLITPTSPNQPFNARTMFVPIPPEDYEAPLRPYRDPEQISQNRLPFMTPIVEQTESSLGLPTMRQEKDYFSSKTPCKPNTRQEPRPLMDDFGSSPFREVIGEEVLSERIAQPLLSKTVKPNKSAATNALAKDIVPKGPIIKDSQCNPVDDFTRNQIFAHLQPPLLSYEGFFDHSQEANARGAEIRKYAKAASKIHKNASEKTATNLSMPPSLSFPGSNRQYQIKRELGAGAFAPVYLIENVAEEGEDIDENGRPKAVMGRGVFDAQPRQDLEALKMEDPPTAWEFYIMRQAKRRLGVTRAAESILNVYEMHLYADECYLIEEFRDQGTLLDVINIARAEATAASTGVMDESVVMFFAIELFRTVEALHSKGILHGDLKADNCLVRLDMVDDNAVWTPKYRRDGTGGWNKKGVSLIDFGRGIDMKVFLPDVQFIADWKTSPQDCPEMRELKPWTYQIDYYGLAGIIHSMLFGKYMDTIPIAASASSTAGMAFGAAAKKTYRVRENFKRYWQTDIWKGVFDLLLNPGMHVEGEEGTKMPVLKGMKHAREEMESWLESNCEKGNGLQPTLRKIEGIVNARRK